MIPAQPVPHMQDLLMHGVVSGNVTSPIFASRRFIFSSLLLFDSDYGFSRRNVGTILVSSVCAWGLRT
jgi:hypothetical protein